MKIFTIGFTNKRAEHFFESLQRAGVRRVIDVRLNNVSQLAGFSKRGDLAYFLRRIAGIDYEHALDLAPTKALLDSYRATTNWAQYEAAFLDLMKSRRIDEILAKDFLHEACLLCSEDTSHHCHRRLVAEYLADHWPGVSIQHLA